MNNKLDDTEFNQLTKNTKRLIYNYLSMNNMKQTRELVSNISGEEINFLISLEPTVTNNHLQEERTMEEILNEGNINAFQYFSHQLYRGSSSFPNNRHCEYD